MNREGVLLPRPPSFAYRPALVCVRPFRAGIGAGQKGEGRAPSHSRAALRILGLRADRGRRGAHRAALGLRTAHGRLHVPEGEGGVKSKEGASSSHVRRGACATSQFSRPGRVPPGMCAVGWKHPQRWRGCEKGSALIPPCSQAHPPVSASPW
jgi:hypothetical protein